MSIGFRDPESAPCSTPPPLIFSRGAQGNQQSLGWAFSVSQLCEKPFELFGGRYSLGDDILWVVPP